MKRIILAFSVVLLASQVVLAEPEEKKGVLGKIGDAVGGTASAIGGTVKGLGEKIVGDDVPVAEARAEVDQHVEPTLKKLFKDDKFAQAMFNESYGYAVFDSRKFAFMISTGFGAGVAIEKNSNKRTYMKMATGGVNIGVGVNYFQLVFLFETKESFESFVNHGWEAGGEASAVFGRDSLEAEVRFVDGKAVYQLTETGINLDVNVTGTKYWKDSDLNEVSKG